MGQRYVEKMLGWYLADSRAFIFLLEVDGRCVGYCGGLLADGVTRVGSASSMIQHSYREAVRTFLKRPWLLLHPEFRPKYGLALRNVMKRIHKKFGAKEKPLVSTGIEPHTGLIVIGLLPEYQGRGFGSMMLLEFERISRERGFSLMTLTVRPENESAIRSYQRNGWQIITRESNSLTLEKRIT
jgi:hypothetical protein